MGSNAEIDLVQDSLIIILKGESHQALLTLQKGVADHSQEGVRSSVLTPSEKMAKAKAMLLVARLMEESSSFDSNTVLKQFREVWTVFYCAFFTAVVHFYRLWRVDSSLDSTAFSLFYFML